ncbi:TetR/AcrR family transcriptional regulator [Thalassobaculum litoreum]|uniref:Transcriptional regulator, TetR family n=1 Tax=Thalassobaculum litoreum DSM 18839 TaxID=1123362 RepID=A0A8G2BIY6_9PROT|nr:TetR/AcrR family transcriptional regulator [Thalassobaculum litoreum]SDF74479.1 transcriptional regulator, TetR family [Thalassobaculum litoreum DSM 18839]
MQQIKHRTNEARTAATRAALIGAARTLFVEKGYGETGTPEIVAAANVTRGALYHHFADKADLFRAVVTAEAAALAEAIDRATIPVAAPRTALIEGTGAYFAAMTVPGRARLLLLDGPAVLGPQTMAELDRSLGGATLRQGLAEAMRRVDPVELDALADCLSAAFDRAALAIAGGADPAPYCAAITRLIDATLRTGRP